MLKENRNVNCRVLSEKEVAVVSGGFWGIALAIVGAVIAGCATSPKKKQHKWQDPHNNFPGPQNDPHNQ